MTSERAIDNLIKISVLRLEEDPDPVERAWDLRLTDKADKKTRLHPYTRKRMESRETSV